MRVANTYWVDKRIRAQRALPRTRTLATVREVPLDLVVPQGDFAHRDSFIPAWVIFAMVLLATFAVCVTVNVRTRSKMVSASEQFALIQSDVETLRAINATLQQDVDKLRNDPRTIEAAARSRLNMLRGNEIVVPIE